MTNLSMRLDFRLGPGGMPRHELFAAALEITKWADRVGFDHVMFPEHHTAIKEAAEAPTGLRTSIRGGLFTNAQDVSSLRQNPPYAILTPDECVRLGREAGFLRFAPLCGGLPADLAWKSLDLFEARVLPHLHEPDEGTPRVIPWDTAPNERGPRYD